MKRKTYPRLENNNNNNLTTYSIKNKRRIQI